jgi:hypothetical protein
MDRMLTCQSIVDALSPDNFGAPIMIASTQLSAVGTGKCTASGRRFDRLWRSIRERISVWATTSADYFAAAGVYEDLSRLSDQELQRRGFSWATLARDVCAVFERPQWGRGTA